MQYFAWWLLSLAWLDFFGLREFVLGFLTRGPFIQNSHTTEVTQSSLSEKHHCRSHSFCPCFEAVFNGICDFFVWSKRIGASGVGSREHMTEIWLHRTSWSTVRVVTCFNWSMIFVLSWTLSKWIVKVGKRVLKPNLFVSPNAFDSGLATSKPVPVPLGPPWGTDGEGEVLLGHENRGRKSTACFLLC